MRRIHAFTFFEMMVVAVILLLVSVLALPRLSKIPQRIERENALTELRNAITEASIRARANGKALELILDIDNSTFEIEELSDSLDSLKGWIPPAHQSEEIQERQSMIVSSNTSFQLSKSIDWRPEDTGLDQFEYIAFAFFEDGQASGIPIRFYINDIYYELGVDKLTGAALIEEFN